MLSVVCVCVCLVFLCVWCLCECAVCVVCVGECVIAILEALGIIHIVFIVRHFGNYLISCLLNFDCIVVYAFYVPFF